MNEPSISSHALLLQIIFAIEEFKKSVQAGDDKAKIFYKGYFRALKNLAADHGYLTKEEIYAYRDKILGDIQAENTPTDLDRPAIFRTNGARAREAT